MTLGEFGDDEFGVSPYGSIFPPFGIESAVSLSATTVRVRFTAMFDQGFVPFFVPANYSIAPGLIIHAVVPESAQSVILVTDPQASVLYTVTITDAQGFFGQPLDPVLDSATFLGNVQNTFFAVATGVRRVRAVFSTDMLDGPDLVDPTKYSVTDLSLNSVSVVSVQKEQATTPVSVVLTLGEDLDDEQFYQLVLDPLIITSGGAPIVPNVSVFQWVRNELRLSIPLDHFSGEVTDPIYGIHNGLVFFSPSLLTAAPNSTIQIEEVSVCTKAFDEYQFPQPVDPIPLFTHGAGVVPTPATTTLNSSVLWAPFPRLFEATMVVSDTQTETMPQASDGYVTATFTQAWDLSYVSLLNVTDWKLFDNGATPPEYFRTADNLAPIPPGPTTCVVLGGFFLPGDSELTATATVTP